MSRTGSGLPPSGAPPAPTLAFTAWAFAGTLLALGLSGWLSVASGMPWQIAPFGASCALAFGLPASPVAQPRAIVGGHLLSAAIGLAVLALLGPQWWTAALGSALALAAMLQWRMLHPPAGANPLLLVAMAAGGSLPEWHFLLMPVLSGSLVIVGSAWLVNTLRQRGSYPTHWW
jgi:CBS-domain-containing membrane protein